MFLANISGTASELHISEIETEIEDNNVEYDSSNDASRVKQL